jgi:uncharacterized membrane protein YhaH (DUF805 family)
MNGFHAKRVWFWLAMVVVAIAVIVLVAPHTSNTAEHQSWLALFPVFFLGLAASCPVRTLAAVRTIGNPRKAPSLVPLFQRPPPAQLA